MRPESYDGEKSTKDSNVSLTRVAQIDLDSIALPTVSNILPLGKFFLLLIFFQMFRSHRYISCFVDTTLLAGQFPYFIELV